MDSVPPSAPSEALRAVTEAWEAPPSLPPGAEPIRSRVLLLASTYACLVLMQRIAEATSLSLFIESIGADSLPLSYLAVSLVDLPLAFAYMHMAKRTSRRGMMVRLAGALVVALVVARLLVFVSPQAGMFAAYLSATTLSTFLVIHWGVLLLDVFSVDESRRAFPLVYAGAHLGSFAAGAAMRFLAGPLSSVNLLVVLPAGAFVAMAILLLAIRRLREGQDTGRETIPTPNAAPVAAAFQSLGLLRTSPLLRSIAIATSLMVLLRLGVRTLYGAELDSAFSSPDQTTRFLGTYTMVASVAGVLLQVLAIPRLLRWLGLGTLNLAYALAAFGSVLGLTVHPGLGAAAAARFTDMELKGAVKTPLSAMFYDAMLPEDRADARAIVLGIISPVASLGSSLVLVVLVTAGSAPVWLAWASCLVAIAYLLISLRQARAYQAALRAQLLAWAQRQGGAPMTMQEAITTARKSKEARWESLARAVQRGWRA